MGGGFLLIVIRAITRIKDRTGIERNPTRNTTAGSLIAHLAYDAAGGGNRMRIDTCHVVPLLAGV